MASLKELTKGQGRDFKFFFHYYSSIIMILRFTIVSIDIDYRALKKKNFCSIFQNISKRLNYLCGQQKNGILKDVVFFKSLWVKDQILNANMIKNK